MSIGLRNIPEDKRLAVVRRRLQSLTAKDAKPGLGTLAALDYGPAIARKAKKAQDNK